MNLDGITVGITIWNKEGLIPKIVKGLTENLTQNDQVLFLLDNCTDNSRNVLIDCIEGKPNWGIITIKNGDLFETKANNYLLRRIISDQGIREENKNVIALFQDDMILMDPDFKKKIFNIVQDFDSRGKLNKLGLIGGRTGFEIGPDLSFPEKTHHRVSNWEHLESQYEERLGEAQWRIRTFLNRGPIVFTRNLIDEVGYLDEAYCPQWGDDMDYCAKAHFLYGRSNIVFECKVESPLEWGGTRNKGSKLRRSKHVQKNWQTFIDRWGKYLV